MMEDDSSQEELNANCYCDQQRDLSSVEVQCFRCLKWFHEKCALTINQKCLKFQTNYTFLCKSCNCGQEVFARRQTNFSQMCETALANLMNDNPERVVFSKDREIIPFIENNWETLTTMPRRIKQTWHNTVVKTMSKESETFIQDSRDQNDPHFALRNQDLTRIGPNYETVVRQKPSEPRSFGRGAKRKMIGLSDQGNEFAAKRQKSELSQPKLPLNGFPSEYPYNKDGYRYVLAEPDPHSPCRQEFDESQELAGKPIPGWLCRKLMPNSVALSLHDRAMQLKISDDRRLVTGEKGYCMVRANYGVNRGSWYFECKLIDMPEGSAVRLGFAQELANIQAPLGYDRFGYSVRSRKGTKFHESRGFHFSEQSFVVNDVIGFLIDLPLKSCQLPKTFKDKPLVKFKSFLYFEEKDEIPKALKSLQPLKQSKITCFRNGKSLGVAFNDLNEGTYYPAASLYKGATVQFNFGPKFEFPLEGVRPISALVEEQHVEQTLSDLLFLVENKHKLRLDLFYGN